MIEATFTTAQTAKAGQMTTGALQQRIARGLLIGVAPDDESGEPGFTRPGKAGTKRRYSLNTVLEVALAESLKAHMGLPEAYAAAQQFTLRGSQDRFSGFPYPPGAVTLICSTGSETRVIRWKPGEDLFAEARHRLGKPETFVLLDASAVFRRVCESLGLDPVETVSAAYGLLPAHLTTDAD